MIANVTTLRTKRTGIAEAIRTSRNLNMIVFASLVARGDLLLHEARYLHGSIRNLPSGGCPPEEKSTAVS
ncbi:hypothetical protein GCM10010869_37240 [Mesorhizobium tianshanense]|nr:hypothetical protein GCM10010869_37240 [Mesorhizobium tianshanense]